MTEGAMTFMNAMSTDDEMRADVEAVDLTDKDAAAAEVIAIAATYGFELTVADINSASLNRELDMDEMDAVAGGSYYVSPGDNTGCGCEMSGVGSEETEDVGYENKQTVVTWDQYFSGSGSSSGKPGNTPFGPK